MSEPHNNPQRQRGHTTCPSGSLALADHVDLRYRHALFYVAAACSILLLLVMALPIFMGHVYVADDLGQFHLPARAFYAACLTEGHAFDWWPQLYNGVYLTGEGQAGTYHPLHLTLYRFLPLSLAFDLEVWLNYPLMLWGTFLWLRRRLSGRDIAMFGALVFTFSGFNLLHFVHVNAIAVVAHLPWLLWALDRALTGRRTGLRSSLVLIALLTASQILLGYPQYVWFSLIAEVIYVACQVPTPFSLARIAAAKLIGLLIGAVQWLPTVDALNHSVRSTADAQFINNGSLHPLNLVQLVAPYLFEQRVVGQNTHELGLYIGAVPFLLVAWLLLSGSPARRQKRVFQFCCLLVPVALLLAMGSYANLYQVQTWLPVVGSFRFPCRTIVLFHLAMAVLAAIALDRVVLPLTLGSRRSRVSTPAASGTYRTPETSPVSSATPVEQLDDSSRGAISTTTRHASSDSAGSQWCIVVASIVIAATAPLLWSLQVASWPLVIAGPILLIAAAWLLQRAQCGARWAPLALVVLTAIDQGLYGLSYAALSRTETLQKFAQNSEIQPAGPAGARVALDADSALRDGTRHGNQLLLAGWSRVGGYLGLPPQRVLDYRGTNAIRVAGSWWVNNAQLADTQSISFARVKQPVAYARLVNRAICSKSPGEDLEKIDVDRAALVEFPLELPSGQTGEVHPLAKSPGHLSLVAVTPSRQLLVVAESFHEGWQAFIDGQPANVWRVNGDYMGCEVPAGRHHVELLFLPASLKKGATFTWCGLGLMLCGFLATCRGNGRGAASMGHGECLARGESRNEP